MIKKNSLKENIIFLLIKEKLQLTYDWKKL